MRNETMTDYVLIVDDDEDSRQILSVIVKSLSRTFKTAANGISALECVKEEIPALILLDLMMPGMDGFGVLSHIRSDPQTRRIPVIVVTGYSVDQASMLKLPGVKEVVQKGNLISLRNLIQEALESNLTTYRIKVDHRDRNSMILN